MKRFLSLVLTLVMVMSLVTVSAGAKDFTDGDKITYEEAVSVISTIGVVDGDTNGAFRPTDTLTRQAAAKIICNLILGPTTAAELHADTAPYKDVAANNQFAGYIAYCQSRGIISGYADGTFRPTGTLTGYAFMKMLLGALGYDSSLEGYVGSNWSINVAKQALGIGLNKGLEGEFNGIKAVTREEACLYAFRTIQADLVEYGQRLTTSVNGTEVTLSSGGARSREWNSQQSRYDNIRADNLIQFAEEYFNKLEKKKTTDDFERPSYTWIYDKNEIGTYVDWELMVEEYTAGVSGRDVYDLLGTATIRDNDLVYYVDGLTPSTTHPLIGKAGVAAASVDGGKNILKKDLVRSNQDDLGVTDNGVLTQIFLDKDADLITIVSIDTWLAQATGDYSESKEYAPLNVFLKDADGNGFNVDVEDVASVVDVKDEDFYLVNITYKNNVKGDVVTISTPEIMEDSTITKFSTSKNANNNGYPTKLTTGGTEYKKAAQAWYDEDSLEEYYDQLLTNITYTVYMDPYGYFIGVEVYEGEKNYVFITGFDRIVSNLSVKTADAVGIFLDGRMEQFKVNVSDTDKNIGSVAYDGSNIKRTADKSGNGSGYFVKWTDIANLDTMYGVNSAANNGVYNVNRWFTYTVNDNGVYTLKPATRMNAEFFAKPATGTEVIKTAHVNISDNVLGERTPAAGATTPAWPYDATTRTYGNDDSVYLTVDLDVVDTTSGNKWAVTDVNGVYTGVQNVEIEIDTRAAVVTSQEAQVYTVYDKNYFVIGAVVIGEGNGSNANIIYRLSQTKSEEIKDGTYYWEFDAFDGEKKTLTVKSKDTMLRTQINTDADAIMKLRYDADGYVVGYNDITKLYTDFTVNDADTKDVYYITGRDAALYPNWTATKLTQEGNTLYVTTAQTDVGLALRPDAKALTIQTENGSTEKTEFTSVKNALAHLADKDENTPGLQYQGSVIAALNSDGAALWVVFVNDIALRTGKDPNYDSTRITITHGIAGAISVTGPKGTSAAAAFDAILAQLRTEGYEITWSTISGDNSINIVARRDGMTTNFFYNHGTNFTSTEKLAYEETSKVADKLVSDIAAGTTEINVKGITSNDTAISDPADVAAAAESAVKQALGNPDNVTISVGNATNITPAKPGTASKPDGEPGEAIIPVTITDKDTGVSKVVHIKVKLTAKAYSDTAGAADLENAEAALASLKTSYVNTDPSNYTAATFKTKVVEDAQAAVDALVGEGKVTVTAADFVTEGESKTFVAPVNATATSSTVTNGSAKVTFTLTKGAGVNAPTSEVTKNFTIRALPYEETDEFTKLTEATKAARVEVITGQGGTEGVTATMSGKAVTATGSVTVADANKNDFQSGFEAIWTKGNSILLTIGHYLPKSGDYYADGVTVTFGGAAGSKNAYTLTSTNDLLVKVPVAVENGKGTTQTYTVQWYKGGTISGMEITGGTKVGDPITITIDATGVTHVFSPAVGG